VAAGDPWEEVRKVVRQALADVESRLSAGKLLVPPSVFVRALFGSVGVVNARAERICTTVVGEHAPRFFQPFFAGARPADEPFDFSGYLRGRRMTVKVVSGSRAFNTKMRRAVEEASYSFENPYILTVQGGYFQPRQVGAAVWLSAPASWKLVAGEGAYRRFLDIVYEEAKPYRARLVALLKSAREGA
jgi:hypothetical protein